MEVSANKNFGNRDIYQIAHEQEGDPFNKTADLIYELVNINGGEIKWSMSLDNDAALLCMESILSNVDDSEQYPFNVVTEKLEIKQETYKSPRCYEGCYYIRLNSCVEGPFDDQVFISEYYIEQFRNGTYFGTMRRFYIDDPNIAHDNNLKSSEMRILDNVENMTLYDLLNLNTILQKHAEYSKEAVKIKDLLQEH